MRPDGAGFRFVMQREGRVLPKPRLVFAEQHLLYSVVVSHFYLGRLILSGALGWMSGPRLVFVRLVRWGVTYFST